MVTIFRTGLLTATLLGLLGMPVFAAEPNLSALVQAADAGDMVAQFDLGNRYLNGIDVARDEFEALRWFVLAAEQGNSNAQYNIAVMYLNGIGVNQDAEQAVRWFLAAAESGDVNSQFTLGIILFNGQLNVPQNTAEAYKWFTLAGAGGHQTAAANAVLVQELLPPQDVSAMQQAAIDWIEVFNARRQSAAGADTAGVAP